MNIHKKKSLNHSSDRANHKTNQPKKSLKNFSSTIALFVIAPIFAFFITSHVFHSYEIDGMSMDITLQTGDRLLVNKLTKTVSNLKNSTYLPNRYDIVVFDRPEEIKSSNSVKHIIKRVIALPGERITIKDSVVTVYNIDNPDGFNPDLNQEYAKGIIATPGDVNITVGQGEVFVMGDNRTNSTDSRRFGSISTKTIVGDAIMRFIPVNGMKRL